MMAGYAFHVGLFHSLLFAGFHRRFHNVPSNPAHSLGPPLFHPCQSDFNKREPRSFSSWLDSEIAGWLNSRKAQQNYPISPASINQCTSVKIRGQKSFLFNPPGFRPTTHDSHPTLFNPCESVFNKREPRSFSYCQIPRHLNSQKAQHNPRSIHIQQSVPIRANPWATLPLQSPCPPLTSRTYKLSCKTTSPETPLKPCSGPPLFNPCQSDFNKREPRSFSSWLDSPTPQ